MERWAAVCGADEVRTYRLCGMPPTAREEARTQLCGARALCYKEGTLLCASAWGDTLWQLNARTLAPLRVFPLGPGVCRLIAAPQEGTLFALCEDADSVLAVSIHTGELLMLARVGVQPRDMVLDARAQRLWVASGAACGASMLCARTLLTLETVQTPGLCVGAAAAFGTLYTLSMTEQATGVLCTHGHAARAQAVFSVPALPGGLCPMGYGVLAMHWGGATGVRADGEVARTFFMDGLWERAAVLPGGVIVCQPSGARCVLWTTLGAQALGGGSDACVYELP